VQGTLQDTQHIRANVADYGIPHFPVLPDVSGSSCLVLVSPTLISTNNPLTMPGPCGSKHISQCRTCSRYPRTASSHFSRVYQLTFAACIPCSCWTVPRRRTRETIILITHLGMLATYRARPRLPFLVHRLTAPPHLGSSLRQRICDNWRVAACTIRIHRLTWSEWNQAPLGGLKW